MNNSASCLCGEIGWQISGTPFQAFNCHCRQCRRAHGTAFGTYWFVEAQQFEWTSATDGIVHYRSSDRVTRSFCQTCGSVVPYPSQRSSLMVVPGGCHDEGRRSQCEIFVAHKAPWFDIESEMPQHDDYPPVTGYQRVEEEPPGEPIDGVVRGSCMCGEVSFHVTGDISLVQHCHCSRCRRGRAAAHATNGFTSIEGVTFVSGENFVKTYKVSDAEFFTQAFCSICGSKVARLDPAREIAVIHLVALDDDPGARPARHIFAGDKAAWHDIHGDLPVFEGAPPPA